MRNYCLLIFGLLFVAEGLFGQTICITFSYDDSSNRIKRFTDYNCDGTPFLEEKDTVQLADDVYSLQDLEAEGEAATDDELATKGEDESKLLEDVLFTNSFDAIKIYPNPVRDNLFVRQSLSGRLRAKIFYVDGRIIKDDIVLVDFNEINVANFIQGIYIIELYPDGDTPVRFKFEKL